MQCPHCDQSLNTETCPHCEAELLDSGPYCSYCGKRRAGTQPEVEPSFAVGSEQPAMTGDSEGIDWDQRTLCSDGNCIGVIGPDGRCKECGKPLHEELSEQRENA